MQFGLADLVPPWHTGTRAVNTFTTKQDVSPSPLAVLPPGRLVPGTKLNLEAWGDFSTTGTPNLTLGFWQGTRAASITGDIALSSVITTGSGAAAWPWHMVWSGTCTAVGTTGTLIGSGFLVFGTSLTAVSLFPIPITAALRTVTIDTTIERAVGVSATWSASSASNQVTVNGVQVLTLN